MNLRTSVTLFALRSTTRVAWWLAHLSHSVSKLGERIEGAVDALALRARVDIAEVLEPLVAEHITD